MKIKDEIIFLLIFILPYHFKGYDMVMISNTIFATTKYYWPLNNSLNCSDGKTGFEYIGSNEPLTASFTTDRFSNRLSAMVFNGVGYLYASSVNIRDKISFSLWIYVEKDSKIEFNIINLAGSDTVSVCIGLNPKLFIRLSLMGKFVKFEGSVLSKRKWSHLFFEINLKSRFFIYAIDGIITKIPKRLHIPVYARYELSVGKNFLNRIDSKFYDIIISDLKIYDDSLRPNEIDSLNIEKDGKLVVLLKF